LSDRQNFGRGQLWLALSEVGLLASTGFKASTPFTTGLQQAYAEYVSQGL